MFTGPTLGLAEFDPDSLGRNPGRFMTFGSVPNWKKTIAADFCVLRLEQLIFMNSRIWQRSLPIRY